MFGGTNLNKQIIGVSMGAVGGFVACWMFVSMSGCGKGADVIAVVNGESITTEEYVKYLEYKQQVQVTIGDGSVQSLPVASSLGFQALQDLISQRVTMQLAKDKKLYPSESDVTKELEFRKKLEPNFLNAYTQMGLTFDMIRQNLTLDLVQERLLTTGMKPVTMADVEAFRKANPELFKEPARMDISYIVVQDKETQKKVNEELASGQSFTQVALRYSTAPDAKATNAKLLDKSPGNVGGLPAVSGLPPALRNAVQKFKGGETTDWIPLVDGWAKLYVAKVYPSKDVVLDDAKLERLRRRIAQQKGVEARDINRQVLMKLKDSKIDVRRQTYQKQWEEAFKNYMTQSKLNDLTGSSGN